MGIIDQADEPVAQTDVFAVCGFSFILRYIILIYALS